MLWSGTNIRKLLQKDSLVSCNNFFPLVVCTVSSGKILKQLNLSATAINAICTMSMKMH